MQAGFLTSAVSVLRVLALAAIAATALLLGVLVPTAGAEGLLSVKNANATAGASSAVAQTARCNRFAAAARRSTGAAKRRAIARFRACQRQNRSNRQVLSQVRNARYVGVRGDGAGVDYTLCASGRFEGRTTTSSGTGVSEGRRWIVHSARAAQNGRVFTALIIGVRPPQFGNIEFSIARRGETWQIGIESFGRPSQFGTVARTAAPC